MKVRTRYAVVSHSRSGSTMLSTGLGKHSEVHAHYEIFNEHLDQRARATKRSLPYREPEPANVFLDRLFELADGWCWPTCSGFKLFYDHAQTGAAQSAWTWIERNVDVHIIHLVRSNLFDSRVSYEVAKHTGQWSLLCGDRAAKPPPPFEIDAAACERFFEWVVEQRELTRRRFVRNPWIEIEYERDLVSQWPATMTRLQEFLRLPHESIEPISFRQQARAVRNQVSNYSILARRWAGSRWAAFIEDGSGYCDSPE
jgi:LPS sulfotransferase NodH